MNTLPVDKWMARAWQEMPVKVSRIPEGKTTEVIEQLLWYYNRGFESSHAARCIVIKH